MKTNYLKLFLYLLLITSILLFFFYFFISSRSGKDNKSELSYFIDASSNNFPPMNMLDENGNLIGFGRDIADAVINEIGGKITHIHSHHWVQVLKWLDSGQADFIHDTGYTKERDKFLDYSKPIIEMPEVIFVRSDQYNITDLNSLKGKIVACVNKHITHLYLQKFPEIKCYVVKTPVQGLYELIAGKADAFIYPKQIILYLIQELRLGHKIKITGEPLRTLSWSMVVKEGNIKMLNLLNKGIARVRETGEYERIYNKWWGKKILAGYSKQELQIITAISTIISISLVLAITLLFVNIRLRKDKEVLKAEITRREKAEETLSLSENKYKILIENLPQKIFYKDINSIYITCNENFAKDLHISSDEVRGKNDYDFFPKELAEKYRKDDRRIINSGKAEDIIEKYILKGQEFTIQTVKTIIKDKAGNISGLLGIFWDITKHKQAEDELKRLQNLLSNIINSMPSILVGVNKDGLVTQWNRQAEIITGVMAESARGQLLSDVLPQLTSEMKKVEAAINTLKPQKDLRVKSLLKGQSQFSDVMVYPLISNGSEGAVIRVDDVTERVRIEEMMIQTEKMLSVGGLAAGMAHEINNPLAGILQSVQVMRNRILGNLKKNKSMAEELGINFDDIKVYMEKRGILTMMDSIEESGIRAAKIVENMLSFSRKSESNFALHNIAELLNKTIELAKSDYDLKKRYDFRQIKIIREYDLSLPQIPCEATKIQQVFLNILKNGAQAMSENKNKEKIPCFILRLIFKNDMICIEIEDNGPGMNEYVCRRIFEPFYTTKDVGIGTGLGLSVSYFIITQNHKGSMSVESRLGCGTKFIIHLPIKPI